MNIAVGKKLPSFELPNQNEELISSSSLLGSKYILFFYPKDDSPGCTKEACSIRDNFKKLEGKGYKVFGISPDKPKKHVKFIEKYEFQYDLLADTERKMLEDFGLWGPKKFMGREVIGVYRTTVLVNEKGIVDVIIDKVKTKEHGNQILDAISDLEKVPA